MKTNKLFYLECHLAGRQYHDADEVWDKLKIGTIVRLERDLENRYDRDAVAVMYDDENESYLLGYIPRGENIMLTPFIDMGWEKCFQCRISKINPDEHYENQIRLTIWITQNTTETKL
jgi:hypothetical protein